MFDRVRRALEGEQDVAYAVLFGSGARGALRPASDVDIAIELRRGTPRDPATLGRLTARLESAAEREVDLVLIDEAPAPLAYRIVRGDQQCAGDEADACAGRWVEPAHQRRVARAPGAISASASAGSPAMCS